MKNKNSKLEEVGLHGMALKLFPADLELLFRPGSLEPAIDHIKELATQSRIMIRGALNELRGAMELQIETRVRELEMMIDGGVTDDKLISAMSQFGSQNNWSAKTTLHEMRAVAVDLLAERIRILDDHFRSQEPEVGTVAYAVAQATIIDKSIRNQRPGWPLGAIFR